jgi:hypothetical protein
MAVVALPNRLRDRIVSALLLAFGVGLLGSYILIVLSGTIPPQKTDFITYFSAARLVLLGHGGSLYDLSALSGVERHVVSPYHLTYGVLPYVYPPYFAVATAPLGVAGLVPAYAVWAAVNVVLLSLALVVIQRRAYLSMNMTLALWLGAWTFIPTFIGLLHGQVSFLLLALMGGALLSLEARRDVLAGALLGVAMLKPTYVLPCLIVLLVRGRLRALASFIGTTVLLAVAPMPLFGARTDFDYLDMLRQATSWTTQYGYGPENTASLAGPLRDLLPASVAFAVLIAVTLAALAGLAVLSRRSPTLALPYALAIVIGLLVSPHVLVHDLVLLLIPAGIALQTHARGPSWLPACLLGLYGMAVAGLVLANLVHVQLIILAMAALAAWLALSSTRREKIVAS